MLGLGPTELVLIFALALLILGPKRLPEIARSIGKAIREIRRSTEQIESEVRKEFLDLKEDVEKGTKPESQES